MSNFIAKATRVLKNPAKVFAFFGNKGFFKKLDDKKYLSLYFKGVFGIELNWNNPTTFNEKLQWLKIYDRNPEYIPMVDKYEVKQLVGDLIGEQYIIPSYGVWDSFDDIDFSNLPDSFVLKCTHDSGGLVICKDKDSFDYKKAREKISKCLKHNFYYYGREWPYKNVKPRIIAEKLMEDSLLEELRDYKFFCFNGVAKCFKVDFDRFLKHGANYYDFNGNLLQIGEEICPPNPEKAIELPRTFLVMKELAEKLSTNIPFVRVDFYEVDGFVFFGELTFYPASGFGRFIFNDNDEMLGSWIKLPY